MAESPTWGPLFTLTGPQLAWALIIYGAVAASLPVWLMLWRRATTSAPSKIGTIVALALGIYFVAPLLSMPSIALLLCTCVLVKMKRERYVWITLVPTAWLLVTTLTAGVQKIFHPSPNIGFLALADRFSTAAAQGTVLAPAKTSAEMQRVAFNNYLDAAVCGFFVLLVVAMCFFALRICARALKQAKPTAHEIPPVATRQAPV